MENVPTVETSVNKPDVSDVVGDIISGNKVPEETVRRAFEDKKIADIVADIYANPPLMLKRNRDQKLPRLLNPEYTPEHKTPTFSITEPNEEDIRLSEKVENHEFSGNELTKTMVTEVASYLTTPLVTDDMTQGERDIWLDNHMDAMREIGVTIGSDRLEHHFTNEIKRNKIVGARINIVIGYTSELLIDNPDDNLQEKLNALKEMTDGNPEKQIPDYRKRTLSEKIDVVHATEQLARDVIEHFTQS